MVNDPGDLMPPATAPCGRRIMRPQFDLAIAEALAKTIVVRLYPYCSKIEIAGSIRRRMPKVHDIDIVLIPSDPWNLEHEITGLALSGIRSRSGNKITSFVNSGIPVDLYYADDTTWSTLLLIRTGSRDFNIRLCSLARRMGWRLHADGSGLFDNNGKRIAGETEESVMRRLGLRYFPPQYR